MITDAFPLTYTEDNILDAPAGVGLAVAGGYQVLIGPLPAGTHTIEVSGPGASGRGFTVTYEITVVAPDVAEP